MLQESKYTYLEQFDGKIIWSENETHSWKNETHSEIEAHSD